MTIRDNNIKIMTCKSFFLGSVFPRLGPNILGFYSDGFRLKINPSR